MARPRTNIGKCKVECCDLNAEASQLCWKHYKRKQNHGDTSVVKSKGGHNKIYDDDETCAIKDCENKVYAKYLCVNHYNQVQRRKKS